MFIEKEIRKLFISIAIFLVLYVKNKLLIIYNN